MTSAPRYAEIAVPFAMAGTLTYRVPPQFAAMIQVGCRVEVQIGPKPTTGFVLALSSESTLDESRVKPIRTLLDDEPALIPEIIDLCRWAADYYLAPVGEMLRVALPANMSKRGTREVALAADAAQVAAAKEQGIVRDADLALIDELSRRPLPLSTLLDQGRVGRAAIDRLATAGIVAIHERFRDAEGVRYDRFVLLVEEPEELTAKQRGAVDLLRARRGEASVSALEASGVSAAVLGALVKKGAVRIERRPRRHSIDAFLAGAGHVETGELRYSDEQQQAIDAVVEKLGTFAPFLLQGITGSGKTEVYIEVMREAVRRGGQALLLVPEISLTPVFAARLKERFGDRIAILHSNLTPSERFDQWWRARRGEVDVAIGPRSALFSPFTKLGVIIVDEEGDGAYKQEEMPRYNARDLAVVRGSLAQIPVILGSATPSLETRENAARGKYGMLRLTRRVESRPLPEVGVIDIRRERGEKEDRGLVIFSDPLKAALRETFDAGEQAIILMNRRGYAPYLLCRECGQEYRCTDCSVTMTVHRRDGSLICHYCGNRRRIPAHCDLCRGEVLQPIGFGTEKVEERFKRDFPDVPCGVLDRDSTRRKGSLVAILNDFRRGITRALIGTQMLSKGHHFPSVTMTAVLNADSILGYPDFRSAEKTFYLLTQVAGRSGRGELPGRVLIQSAFPQHYAVLCAMNHDYDAFYEAEIQFRKTFHYPPVTTMIALLFRGPDFAAVDRAALEFGRRLEEAIQPLEGTRLQGPAPAPLARLKGEWRYQILVRSPHRTALRRAVAAVLDGHRAAGVDVVVDVDPINIL